MGSELVRLLQDMSKKQLLLLLQQMIARYPALLADIAQWLEQGQGAEQPVQGNETEEIDEEVTEDWDFSGEEPASHTLARLAFQPVVYELYQQRIAAYSTRLEQGEEAQTVQSDLVDIVWEAELRAEQHDYHGALGLYSLILDTYLTTQREDLSDIFGQALDDTLPSLETLLAEASSTLQVDAGRNLSPLMNQDDRHRWLERLFSLWLKYLEAPRSVERISELLHTVAWSEDRDLLRTFISRELQQYVKEEPTNIVNFAHQYRIRSLERLLKGLS
jgi:hypothetical protein